MGGFDAVWVCGGRVGVGVVCEGGGGAVGWEVVVWVSFYFYFRPGGLAGAGALRAG